MYSLNVDSLLDSRYCKITVLLHAVEDLSTAICASQTLSFPEGNQLHFSRLLSQLRQPQRAAQSCGRRIPVQQELLCCCTSTLSLQEQELEAPSNIQGLLDFPLSTTFLQKHVQKPQCNFKGIWDPLESKLV